MSGSPSLTAPLVVALVDDDDDLRTATAQLLSLAGHEVRPFAAAAPALAAIDDSFPGVVVTDVRMPGMSGIELFRALVGRDAELPVILITGHGDVEMAVSALKDGAWDFLSKPFDPDALLAAVARAATARALAMENRRLRTLAEESAADELVGQSPAIRRLRTTLPVVADADLDVVLEGETGTGKQLLARLIHRASRRNRHRLVTLDCAVLPAAAEDAAFDAHGAISRAGRGTLFLDNLDRADERLQHRLAQFVERRAVALDTRDPVPVDARIIAAVDEGGRSRVLPTLFHRLAAVTLRLPPLAERPEDVPLLVAHFLAAQGGGRSQSARAPSDLAHLTGRRTWPGNVRELEMAVARAALGLDEAAPVSADLPLPERVRAYEQALIVDAVTRAGGEVSRAVDLLGIPRETFYYRVKRLGIDLKRLRGAPGAG
ncbi:two-component system, NtrC family, C4-dicarboxylate transport response regulator DctD [Sphingomonas gellani]|uniref:Two-component system, NtrC family, C4-dicarboxylate transport response regulator DctD n=1 Tax=Sphingomonas gellani TaxID=1166340 RepID=A0A1H8CVK0_9SPHN|nr:sigma-54 dependent transcriptional regulator [Sphingomonas gellani]SEM98902.1 two-component system, NtrC family, C4-dicarboxylate transport response regulator DctD [Sphingomonas gellani]